MLDKIIEEIKAGYKDNLRAICLTGSCASDDFIAGISDFDVVAILKQVTEADKQLISKIGEKLKLTDEYNIIPKSVDDITKTTGLWKLLNKHHCKYLFGEDFKQELAEPAPEELARDTLTLLRKLNSKFDKWKYATFKSDRAFKEGMYWVLKRAITLFASAYFLETGEYFNERRSLALRDKNISGIVDVLNKWPEATRQEIRNTFPNIEYVVKYVRTISEGKAGEMKESRICDFE